jgi:EAL domain-containing protein (putative c-di-GMP-specific phosphodiesterase class I)
VDYESLPAELGDLLAALQAHLGLEVTVDLGVDGSRARSVDRLDPAGEANPVLITVPIAFSDGSERGFLSCRSRRGSHPDDRDRQVVAMVAQLVAVRLEPLEAARREGERQRRLVRDVALARGISTVFQPIVHLATKQITGFEALSRFPGEEGPEWWFARAWEAGLGADLELAAVRAAFGGLAHLPGDAYLAVNVSPTAMIDPRFLGTVTSVDPRRIVVEVTEHDAVEDYGRLAAVGAALRGLGVRIAIDDVGMGVASLVHLVQLSPDIIKVDAGLVRAVDSSAARQAMIAALVSFAARTGADLVAEGIETADEYEALVALGVPCGQGFHIAVPFPRWMPVASAAPLTGGAVRSDGKDRSLR